MKRRNLLPLLVLLAGLAMSAAKYASAQSQPNPAAVNPVGTWDIVVVELEFYDGMSGDDLNFDSTLTIAEQSGAILRGNSVLPSIPAPLMMARAM